MADDSSELPASRPAPWRGRPRSDNPRNAWVHARVTADERARLSVEAERAGLDLGPYVVQAALGAPRPRQQRRPPVEKVLLASLLGQLGRCSGNINQIARALNSGQEAVPAEIAAALADIREAALAISATLRGKASIGSTSS